MNEGKSDEDVAAVAEVARLYYEGMMSGDKAKLSRAFHPYELTLARADSGNEAPGAPDP
jgi:hypothetical protein